MRIDRTKCDRCGFDQPNPTAFIGPATLKFRRPTQEPSAVEVTQDFCVRCFDEVQALVAAALKAP